VNKLGNGGDGGGGGSGGGEGEGRLLGDMTGEESEMSDIPMMI